jgi:hypothetical protein
MAGLKMRAEIKHMPAIYKVQQLQVQVPNNVTWVWEFDILLGHLLTKLEAVKAAQDAAKKGQPAAPAAAGQPAAPAGQPAAPAAGK